MKISNQPEHILKNINMLEGACSLFFSLFFQEGTFLSPPTPPQSTKNPPLIVNAIINEYYVLGAESMTDEAIHKYYGNNTIMASLNVTEEEKCYR